MPSSIFNLTFDARNAEAIATFWAAVLGRTVSPGATAEGAALDPVDGVPGSRIGFRAVPEDKVVKNRLHLDLATGDFDAEVARVTGLGATVIHEANEGLHYVTMTDPEGNEFDLIAIGA